MSERINSVLILDDDRMLAKMMADYLVLSANCTVDLTHTEADFWRVYAGKQYDLIFMDYRLQEITGIEILGKLLENGNKIPVVMMTGEGTEEIAVKAMQLGAFDYLVKGHYSFSILPSLVIKAVRMRQLQAEMEVSYQQIHYQASLLKNLRDSIVVWDCGGNINFWNQAAENLFGTAAEEQIGKSAQENYFSLFTPPINHSTKSLDASAEIERKFFNQAGEIKWISSVITPLFNDRYTEVIGYMDVVRDISNKKTIENQLQQRLIMEKLLSSISNFFINIEPENTDMGVEKSLLLIGNYLRPDYGAIYLVENHHTLKYYCGFEKSVEKSQKIQDQADIIQIDSFPFLRQKMDSQEPILIDHLDDLPETASLEKEFFSSRHVKSIILVPMVHNNDLIGVLTVFLTKKNQAWQPDHSHLLQTYADMVVNAIIQRKNAEEIRTSEARYRAIVEEHQTELIYRTNPALQFTFVNEKFCDYYHRTREELLGKTFFDLIHAEDVSKVSQILQSSTPDSPISHFESRSTIQKTIRWLEWTVRAIFDPSGKLIDYQGIGRDITDRKEMENQLKAAQTHLAQNTRMAAIGELAASIAHQISNPLTTIIAESQILAHQRDKRTSEYESVAAIEQAGWRAQHVIQELVKFSEPGKNSNELLSVNETIEKALLLTGAHIQANALSSLSFLPSGNLPAVRGNMRQLEDLWITLLILARNATKENQKNSILIKSLPCSDPFGVLITISDQGAPILEDQLESLFEPQLIPTGVGRGTGIELSLCREIVRQHQGTISARIMDGTTQFEIYLPGEPEL
jgi:PAS domain S-box-containing protein